jgi:hypothetical protein
MHCGTAPARGLATLAGHHRLLCSHAARSARTFVLLLKECAQLLGSDFQQAVCRNAKRLETGVARLHDADFGWHQHRFIEGEMNPDRRECLPSNAPARVVERDVDLLLSRRLDRFPHVDGDPSGVGYQSGGLFQQAHGGGDVVAFRPAGEVDVLREPIARVVAVAQAGAALERPARAR